MSAAVNERTIFEESVEGTTRIVQVARIYQRLALVAASTDDPQSLCAVFITPDQARQLVAVLESLIAEVTQ